LTSAWDQNAGAYACSPSAAIIEEVIGGWLKDILGLPAQASYAFVTGCQMAHVTCLAAARHKVLADVGWPVETRGLAGSPPIRVLVGEHHETLLRALRHLGIGTDAVVQVAMQDDGTLDVAALKVELEKNPDTPTIVSLAAGDLNRGAFDPFEEICDLAHACNAWVHIDGAFGLWVASSPRYRHLVKGIEKADSWATDAHKWLNVPYDSGIAFVADPESHKSAMTIPAAYKVEVANVRDQLEWGPEWSRRARGIPIYAALRTLGRNGVAEMIERCCDLTREFVSELEQLPGVEVLTTPIINQGLVRFIDPDGDHDGWTDEVINRVNASGEAWFGPTVWNGMRVMRISLSNFRTTRSDVDRALEAIKAAIGRP
jgi:glutamate/tyrosine decarboxylase-like PLP-dependent enzyme